MTPIFLSYKHPPQGTAQQLDIALRDELLWDIWWDWNIPPGSDWSAALDQRLGAAQIVLVLWGAQASESPWVLYEARTALAQNKLVQVVLAGGKVPAEFAGRQAVDLSDWSPGTYHSRMGQLRTAVREMMDTHPACRERLCGERIIEVHPEGDVVRQAPQASALPVARPRPSLSLLDAIPDLLHRTQETSDIASALSACRLALSAPHGAGKTSVMRPASRLDHGTRLPDGLVLFLSEAVGAHDLSQQPVELSYDVQLGTQLSAAHPLRALEPIVALLLIDDLRPAARAEDLRQWMRLSDWIVAAHKPLATNEFQTIVLARLPPDDAVRLYERSLGGGGPRPTVQRSVFYLYADGTCEGPSSSSRLMQKAARPATHISLVMDDEVHNFERRDTFRPNAGFLTADQIFADGIAASMTASPEVHGAIGDWADIDAGFGDHRWKVEDDTYDPLPAYATGSPLAATGQGSQARMGYAEAGCQSGRARLPASNDSSADDPRRDSGAPGAGARRTASPRTVIGLDA